MLLVFVVVCLGVILPTGCEHSKASSIAAWGREAQHHAWQRISSQSVSADPPGPGSEQVCSTDLAIQQTLVAVLDEGLGHSQLASHFVSMNLAHRVVSECSLVWPLILWGKNR